MMSPAEQPRLILSLCQCDPWPHPCDAVQLHETHISWVLLVGGYAYKIKKPVDFGFLDFSTLALRHHYCQEELRLNRRLAPDLYLEVVAIGGTEDAPVVGSESQAIEYAVKMRRFDQEALLSNRLATLTPDLMERLARAIADFHTKAPASDADELFGEPEQVIKPMLENFRQLLELGQADETVRRLEKLDQWTRDCGQQLGPVIAARKAHHKVRECHGDLHLGNIALIDDKPVIFDGIEFSPSLRWIDTVSDIAFLVMDLQEKSVPALASRLLNTYLLYSGDYEALRLLRFYQVYRAMVRAKVTALSLQQAHDATLLAAMLAYLGLAESYTGKSNPQLIITCGVSGSGKSHTAQQVADCLPALHIRSDVERKRLADLSPLDNSGSGADRGIYTSAFTRRTYERLLMLARQVIESGYTVVVDATFLKRKWRQEFAQLAAVLDCPFLVLDVDAPETVLRTRIARRREGARDPSEADEKILEKQLLSREPFTREEQQYVLTIRPDQPFSMERLSALIHTESIGSGGD